jgi:ADP-heptose:LPS heptosyltransferase
LGQSNFAFLNLQYGDCRTEISQLREHSGLDLASDDSVDALQDLDRFAAQVAAMDLVITIDNSTAHLAGALGVPVWVLLPAVPEWRWQLERTDSVWYSCARLFRQRSRGDWAPVIEDVAAELGKFGPAALAR